MTRTFVGALALGVVLALSALAGQVWAKPVHSGLAGVAKMGPVSPVERPGYANEIPLAGAIITIQPAGGGQEFPQVALTSAPERR